nr:MAG TPA: hypothetical protein [Caudoviricetes sp.]
MQKRNNRRDYKACVGTQKSTCKYGGVRLLQTCVRKYCGRSFTAFYRQSVKGGA